MKCSECGRELPEGSNYCRFCGAGRPGWEPAETKAQDAAGADLSAEDQPVQNEAVRAEQTAPEAAARDGVKAIALDAVEKVAENDAAGTVPIAAEKTVPAPPVQVAQVATEGPVQYEAEAAAATTSGGAHKKKPIIGAVSALVLIACLGFFVNAQLKARAYRNAMSNYEMGSYQIAADAFEDLGDYQDAAAMKEEALLGVDADALRQKAGKDPAAWEAAAEAYDKVGSTDSAKKAKSCRSYATYYTAKQLMAEKEWVKAKESLTDLASDFFEDSHKLLDECETHIACDEAEALFAKGDYYDAYVIFDSLTGKTGEGLPDFAERAQACVQEFPASGVVYSNPDLSSTEVPLTIKNESTRYVYYKIYQGDTLVRSIFIHPESSAEAGMPAGTYRMNEAFGDMWFGEKDVFGGAGHYFRCIFGEEETVVLEWGYSYEISTSVNLSLDSGTGISNEPLDLESF